MMSMILIDSVRFILEAGGGSDVSGEAIDDEGVFLKHDMSEIQARERGGVLFIYRK